MKIYGTLKEVVATWFRTSSGETVKLTVPANPAVDDVSYQMPDISVGTSDVLVSRTSTDTLTNKTIDADGTGNNISNIDDGNIKSGANIARTKLASGTASHVIVNDGSGVLSSEAQLAASRGGTGISSTATFPSSGVIVTEAATQSLSNKTLVTPVVDDYLDLNEESAPGTPAAGKVRVYAKTDNKLYLKDDLGTETQLGAGGSGEINAITTGSTDATGWSNGTSHTGATDTSNSPLSPVVTTSISALSSAAVSLGSQTSTSGVYKTFTLPTGLENRKLKVEFYFTSPASADGTWAVSVYNSTARLALSTDSSGDTILPSGVTGKFTAYFDTDSLNSYSVNIVQRTRTNANTLYVTNVIVGPGIQPQGAVVNGPISYTPTTDGFGTISSVVAFYSRRGSFLKVEGRFTTGTVNGNIAYVSLPSGLNVDSSVITSNVFVGKWWRNNAGATTRKTGAMATDYTTNANILRFNNDDYTTGVSPSTSLVGSAVAGTGEVVWFDFEVPIAEWAGSGTVQLAQNDVEYAYNTDISSTTSVTASGFAYGPAGQFLGAVAWSLGTDYTRAVRFQTPIQTGDKLEIEIGSGSSWHPIEQRLGSFFTLNGKSYGASISIVSATDAYVTFSGGGYGSPSSFGSNGAAWGIGLNWRVRKSSAGAAVGFGIADTTSSGLVTSGTYNKSTGAWTFGILNAANNHTFYLGPQRTLVTGGSSLPGYYLADDGTGAASGFFTASGTTGIAYNQSDFVITKNSGVNIKGPEFGGGGGNNIARATGDGAWTFGRTTVATPHIMQTDQNGGYALQALNYNSTTPLGIYIRHINGPFNAASREFIYCDDGTTPRFTVRSNGGIANYQANDVNLSDQRLKTNIAPTSPKLDFICSLQVKDFEYKDKPGIVNTGLIAQEVEALNPLLVQDSGFTQTVDGEEVNPKAVRTSEIYHMLIKAVQELKQKNDELEARLAALETP